MSARSLALAAWMMACSLALAARMSTRSVALAARMMACSVALAAWMMACSVALAARIPVTARLARIRAASASERSAPRPRIISPHFSTSVVHLHRLSLTAEHVRHGLLDRLLAPKIPRAAMACPSPAARPVEPRLVQPPTCVGLERGHDPLGRLGRSKHNVNVRGPHMGGKQTPTPDRAGVTQGPQHATTPRPVQPVRGLAHRTGLAEASPHIGRKVWRTRCVSMPVGGAPVIPVQPRAVTGECNQIGVGDAAFRFGAHGPPPLACARGSDNARGSDSAAARMSARSLALAARITVAAQSRLSEPRARASGGPAQAAAPKPQPVRRAAGPQPRRARCAATSRIA